MTAADAISLALHLVCAILLLSSGVVFWVAFKGCRVLRRLAIATTRDDLPILLKSPCVPAASVIAVARDASPATLVFAHQLLELLFARHELVIVLEGVGAEDVAAWRREFHLEPSQRSTSGELPGAPVTGVYESTGSWSMLVLEVPVAKEGESWNVAVNSATCPLVAFFDPDTEVPPDSLLRLVRPMLEEPDLVFAVCGSAPVPPAPGLAGAIGDLEATRTWLGRCAAFAGWKHMLAPVEGSAMLIRRDAVVLAGGFVAGPLELFLNLQGRVRHSGKPYRAEFVPEPLGRLPAPRTWSELRKRVMKGQRGIMGALRHSSAIMDGWFAIGWGLPAVVFHRLICPLLETAAYLTAIAGIPLGLVSPQLGLLVLLATVGVGIPTSISLVVFRELADFRGRDSERLAPLFWAAIVENLGYRQLRNLWLIGGAFSR